MVGAVAVLAIALSGYLFVAKSGSDSNLADAETQIKNLNFKLRSPRFNYRVENTVMLSQDTANNTVTVKDDNGKSLTLTKTASSKVEKVILSADKKTKTWEDSTLSQIEKDAAISVLFNGLDEIVDLTFSNGGI